MVAASKRKTTVKVGNKIQVTTKKGKKFWRALPGFGVDEKPSNKQKRSGGRGVSVGTAAKALAIAGITAGIGVAAASKKKIQAEEIQEEKEQIIPPTQIEEKAKKQFNKIAAGSVIVAGGLAGVLLKDAYTLSQQQKISKEEIESKGGLYDFKLYEMPDGSHQVKCRPNHQVKERYDQFQPGDLIAQRLFHDVDFNEYDSRKNNDILSAGLHYGVYVGKDENGEHQVIQYGQEIKSELIGTGTRKKINFPSVFQSSLDEISIFKAQDKYSASLTAAMAKRQKIVVTGWEKVPLSEKEDTLTKEERLERAKKTIEFIQKEIASDNSEKKYLRYNVISFNCEHIARGIVTGDFKSKQAEAYSWITQLLMDARFAKVHDQEGKIAVSKKDFLANLANNREDSDLTLLDEYVNQYKQEINSRIQSPDMQERLLVKAIADLLLVAISRTTRAEMRTDRESKRKAVRVGNKIQVTTKEGKKFWRALPGFGKDEQPKPKASRGKTTKAAGLKLTGKSLGAIATLLGVAAVAGTATSGNNASIEEEAQLVTEKPVIIPKVTRHHIIPTGLGASIVATGAGVAFYKRLNQKNDLIDNKIEETLTEVSQEIEKELQVESQTSQSREQPLQSREQPLQSREQPLQSREQPLQSREQPLQSREQPLQSREQPLQSREQELENIPTNILNQQIPVNPPAFKPEVIQDPWDDDKEVPSQTQKQLSRQQQPLPQLPAGFTPIYPKLPPSKTIDPTTLNHKLTKIEQFIAKGLTELENQEQNISLSRDRLVTLDQQLKEASDDVSKQAIAEEQLLESNVLQEKLQKRLEKEEEIRKLKEESANTQELMENYRPEWYQEGEDTTLGVKPHKKQADLTAKREDPQEKYEKYLAGQAKPQKKPVKSKQELLEELIEQKKNKDYETRIKAIAASSESEAEKGRQYFEAFAEMYPDEANLIKLFEVSNAVSEPQQKPKGQPGAPLKKYGKGIVDFLNKHAPSHYHSYVDYMTAGSDNELNQIRTLDDYNKFLTRVQRASRKPTKDLYERLEKHYANQYLQQGLDKEQAKIEAQESIKRIYGDFATWSEELDTAIASHQKAMERGELLEKDGRIYHDVSKIKVEADTKDKDIDDWSDDSKRYYFQKVKDALTKDPKEAEAKAKKIQDAFIQGLAERAVSPRRHAKKTIVAETKNTIKMQFPHYPPQLVDDFVDAIAELDTTYMRSQRVIEKFLNAPEIIAEQMELSLEEKMSRRQVLRKGIQSILPIEEFTQEELVKTVAKDPASITDFLKYFDRSARIKAIQLLENPQKNGWLVKKSFLARLFNPFSSPYDFEKSMRLRDMMLHNRSRLARWADKLGVNNPMTVSAKMRRELARKGIKYRIDSNDVYRDIVLRELDQKFSDRLSLYLDQINLANNFRTGDSNIDWGVTPPEFNGDLKNKLQLQEWAEKTATYFYHRLKAATALPVKSSPLSSFSIEGMPKLTAIIQHSQDLHLKAKIFFEEYYKNVGFLIAGNLTPKFFLEKTNILLNLSKNPTAIANMARRNHLPI